MNRNQQQIMDTVKYYARAINATAAENIEIRCTVVPGSCLSRLINNPVDSGIDEA